MNVACANLRECGWGRQPSEARAQANKVVSAVRVLDTVDAVIRVRLSPLRDNEESD